MYCRKIQLSRGDGLYPITQFNPAKDMCLSQARTCIFQCRGYFYVQLEVIAHLLILMELLTITT